MSEESEIPEPIRSDYFDSDLHEVNKEIVRLAFLLNIDLTNPIIIKNLIDKELPNDHEHFYKLETLKGLILLRGHMRLERQESGLVDGSSPIDEPTFKNLHSHDDKK
jgi:hypothetical protein